jgi:cobalt-zinc-cadmium efflux system outer membrane protein
MSEGDLLKIKLQLLQFQSDVSAAKFARVQALAGLRQFLGFESVADDYDVSGDLDYRTLKATLADLKTMAAQSRPDLVAAQQGVTDVVDAYENLRTNDQIIQLYRGGYVDQAKQSRDISEYAYRRGAASLLDYLDSERTYRANQLAYRQALANYMLAIEQLRQAVGTRDLP